jgi:hypothetical protein
MQATAYSRACIRVVGGETMRVQFRTTFPDVVRFIWLHLTRSTGLLLFIGAMALFLTWNDCHSTIMQHGRIVGTIAWLMTAAIIFAGICLFSFVASVLTALSRRNKTFMTDNTIELQEDRFLTENRYGKGEYKWDIVQNIVKTRGRIVLYVTQSTGIVVPRRAFPTAAEWEAFCSFVETHRKK